MSFSPPQISFLQRLVNDRPAMRRTEVARFFCDHYSLGTAIGSRIEYRSDHYALAERLLCAHDLPIGPMGAGATRADASAYGGMSEKSFSASPHSDSVAVKSIGHCTFEEREMHTPDGTYVVLTSDQAKRVMCQRVLVVENLETFRYLAAYTWIDWRDADVLAVYRGELKLPRKDAADVVKNRSEPLWGFFDFDPAGLMMANSLPPERLERILLPSPDWLRTAANTSRGRQLFDAQAKAFGRTLDQASHPAIRELWALMSELRSAVTQERMRDARVSDPRTSD